MRLTHIKLAGFKSFVDPTSVAVPGQLVGVVGPNGCGKSNIIDAVRWVLGETRASALRGESMQDVIFNGSTQRKPVARASVELVFDNAMGRAAGQWSRYAEVAVKRILQRDGDSAYFINNTQVRRRDIQDIFLGTGVGPRAYAIIEQGMISRVIEAKPEDLRVFLEEAAGISRYKERRRETENRLQDTRENLARVDDIRRELDSQLEKLTRQAELARQFQDLQTEMREKQWLLWLIRKREAANEYARVGREVADASLDLEAETTKLREIEKRLEHTRVSHYEAGDALNTAQGELFRVNNEVSRLEAEMKFIAETRQRLYNSGVQLVAQLVQWGRQSMELRDALGMWQARRTQLQAKQAQTESRVTAESAKLPELEQQLRAAQERVREARQLVVDAERALQVDQAHLANLVKTIERLGARDARLSQEAAALAAPDTSEVVRLGATLRAFDAQLARFADDARALEARVPELDAARVASRNQRDALARDVNRLSGQLTALKAIQAKFDENESADAWLQRHALTAMPRVWQNMRVTPGWETAVESVLRERLHGIALTDPQAAEALFASPPSARLTIVHGSPAAAAADADHGRGLASVISAADPAFAAALADWCHGYFLVDTPPSAAQREHLSPGVVLVDRAGHHYRRYSVSYHASDSADSGALARQQEIKGIGRELAALEHARVEARTKAAADEALFEGTSGRVRQLRQQEGQVRAARHAVEIELLRANEAIERVASRHAQIARERDEIKVQIASEQSERGRLEAAISAHTESGGQRRSALDVAGTGEAQEQSRLNAQRAAVEQVRREVQEAAFAVRECEAKIDEIHRSVTSLGTQIEQATQQERAVRAEVAELRDVELRARLDELLSDRVGREEALAEARALHDDLTNQLRANEEERLSCEQKLGPLRERIADLRLKEQAAQLAMSQFEQQLAEAGADEAQLAPKLEKPVRAGALQGDINRLNQTIQSLGAINMAALDELATNQERKQFLDAQSGDLAEALTTLENAIRRIDRETRDMLRQTFDTVNANFSKLFPALFGGGEAKLVMTGEEILDAGVQVMAQPPGKRNTSIHLLSGGEKALTAISLVFSMFQLNPAPFCLLDEVDAPLDDTNTERFCRLVRQMSADTQFLFITHNKITMELASQLVGVTMQEQGVSRIVAVDIDEALKMREAA